MDVQTIEMLNAPGMEGEYAAFQKRDKISQGNTGSRIPTATARSRRATGEDMKRPQLGYGKNNTPTMPRPIPKSNFKKDSQPNTTPSSYRFDDTIDNPFVPSTPPTFTPSMEPTGFFKSEEKKSTSPLPPKAEPESPKATTKINTAAKAKAYNEANTPNTPLSATAKTPINPSFSRSRSGSVGSGLPPGLPGPRHEDMILPAVARRIKEQGLHEHDVIAYSDDYDAPLYKLPGSAASVGNPFASYDKLKAASSASLVQSKSKSSDFYSDIGSDIDPTPPIPPIPAIPSAFDSSAKEIDKDQNVPVSPKTSNLSHQQEQRNHEQEQRNQEQEKRRQEREERRQEREQRRQQQQSSTLALEQQAPTSLVNEQRAEGAPTNDFPETTRPERPRRARRDTDHQARQEQFESAPENRSPRARRPTMPENQTLTQNANAMDQYQDASHMSPRRRHEQRQPYDSINQDRNDGCLQQVYNSPKDHQYYSNEIPIQGGRHRGQANQNSYEPYQNGSPSVRGGEQTYDIRAQEQERQQLDQYQQNSGHQSRSRRPEDGYGRQQKDGYNNEGQGRFDASQQSGHYPQSQSNDHYNQAPYGNGYNTSQNQHYDQQGGYYGGHGGNDVQQNPYNPQQQYSNYNNYGRSNDPHFGQAQDNTQRTSSRSDTLQMEMSEMNHGLNKAVESEGQGNVKNDPGDKNKAKGKGAVCCSIM